MIISDKYKCIFIRIPKTGSTTIEQIFIDADPKCISSDNERPPYGHEGHKALKEISGEYRWKNYFKFAFVRNPYTWFLSNYSDHLGFELDESWGVHEILNERHSLPKLSDNIVDAPKALTLVSMIQFWYHGDFVGGKHDVLTSQSAWISDDIDFIGRLETFEQDLGIVAKTIGLELPKKLEEKNKSYSERLELSQDAVRLITAIYHDDFEKFGYERRK